MTDMEIPDDAVWVAARAYRVFADAHPSHPDAIHAALEAALPHLLAEVKVLTETASKFGYELGRKEALTERPMWRRHRADVGEQIAEELEALNGPITPLAAAAFVRDLTSLPSGATSDATSGVPGHQDVSEAVRSPQDAAPRLVCRRCNGYGLIDRIHGVVSPTPCPDCARTRCPHCGLTDDHKGGCPQTGEGS